MAAGGQPLFSGQPPTRHTLTNNGRRDCASTVLGGTRL